MTSTKKHAVATAIVQMRNDSGSSDRQAVPELTERMEAGQEALSENTRRAYNVALRGWGQWAAVHGVDALAAPAVKLRAYLIERAESGINLPTLHIAIAAVRKLQMLNGVPSSSGDPIITDTLRGLTKRFGRGQRRQAKGLTSPALVAITTTACQPRIGRGGFPESPARARRRGLVDIALCRTMSDGGLRRSEAAALVWEDLEEWEDGSGRITVRSSKTSDAPVVVYLTAAAVDALAAIRPPRAADTDPIFGLTAPTIARRIAAAAKAAGLGGGFSGHSGRVGTARRMAAAGAPTHEIMAQGRWEKSEMVASYTRNEEIGRAGRWLS